MCVSDVMVFRHCRWKSASLLAQNVVSRYWKATTTNALHCVTYLLYDVNITLHDTPINRSTN